MGCPAEYVLATELCELEEGHSGPHRLGDIEWSDPVRITEEVIEPPYKSVGPVILLTGRFASVRIGPEAAVIRTHPSAGVVQDEDLPAWAFATDVLSAIGDIETETGWAFEMGRYINRLLRSEGADAFEAAALLAGAAYRFAEEKLR